jgi:hypothetical protein
MTVMTVITFVLYPVIAMTLLYCHCEAEDRGNLSVSGVMP